MMQNPSETFSYLSRHRHHTADAYQQSLFEEPSQTKIISTEYWLMSDLYNMYGPNIFDIGQSPDRFIQAKINLTPLDKKLARNGIAKTFATVREFYNIHIEMFSHNYTLTPPPGTSTIHRRNTMDARLTRYAIWSALPNTTNMIFDRLYFMLPNVNINTLYKISSEISRIFPRADTAHLERVVGAILHRNNIPFSPFYRDLNRTLFNGYDVNEIKEAHQIEIRQHDPLTNYMGALTLRARNNAVQHAISEFNHTRVQTPDKFYDIMMNNMYDARTQLIRHHGQAPENNISRTPISAICREYNKMEREFIKNFAFRGFEKTK